MQRSRARKIYPEEEEKKINNLRSIKDIEREKELSESSQPEREAERASGEEGA